MHRVRAAAGRLGSRFAGVLGVKIENFIAAGVITGLGGYIYTQEKHITVLPLSRKPRWHPAGPRVLALLHVTGYF